MQVTSNRWQRRRLVRIVLAAAVACAAWAALAPAGARANYDVRECNASVGNIDAGMIRPFGGATKISQSDNCGNWGLRMEANGQSTYNTYVVWQWTAPQNTIFKTAQTQLHYYTHGGYGPMTQRQWAPGYAASGPRGLLGYRRSRATAASMPIYEQCFASPCSSTSAFAYLTDFYAEVQDLAPPSVSASGELARRRSGERGPDGECDSH